MSDFIRIKTSSPAGDLISFMSGFKQLYKEIGKKILVMQRIGMVGVSYADAVHPFKNEEDEPVCMPIEMFQMLRPLFLSQDYIHDFVEWKGEEFDFDMDLIRQERFTNQPRGSLNRWFSYVYPQMQSDLSQKYIQLPKDADSQYAGKVFLNFTQRHRNYLPAYYFLKPYQDRLIFTGLEKERDLFCKAWGLDIPLLKVNHFLELGMALNSCKFLLANASMVFQIAEGLKIPRILEIFPVMPNVIPVGEHAYDAYDESAIRFYFEKLLSV